MASRHRTCSRVPFHQEAALWKRLLQDLRYGWRQLWNRPGLIAIAVASLALGIGANSSISGLVDALLLRALQVAAPERLVSIFTIDPKKPRLQPLRPERAGGSARSLERTIAVCITSEPAKMAGETVLNCRAGTPLGSKTPRNTKKASRNSIRASRNSFLPLRSLKHEARIAKKGREIDNKGL